MNLKAGGMGMLGGEQLAWLADDVKRLSDSTPIVVFAHIPLWTISKEWGWGTEDSEQALSMLKVLANVDTAVTLVTRALPGSGCRTAKPSSSSADGKNRNSSRLAVRPTGHSQEGISQNYIATMILANDPQDARRAGPRLPRQEAILRCDLFIAKGKSKSGQSMRLGAPTIMSTAFS
jgi:hypothetical protein